jgi:lipopolysaccharide/colanic/teichoic acid biosynthesis glycosyltransferase
MPTQLDIHTARGDVSERQTNEPMLAETRPDLPALTHQGNPTAPANPPETGANLSTLAETRPDLPVVAGPNSSAGQGSPQLGPLTDAPPFLYASWKRLADFLIAFFLILLASPVMLVCALLVRLTSRGPALYSQVRLGRNGRPFVIYKFRTMAHNCEKGSGARWSVPGDPRITWLGRFLRRTHLDEFPQLWNVLKGDMSLVGPRPERPEFLPTLEEALPGYRNRLLVRPGITGLAQVQLPADTDIDSVRRKLTYDLFYIRYYGFGLDLRLIICTAFHMCGVPYRTLAILFMLPRPDAHKPSGEKLVPNLEPAS